MSSTKLYTDGPNTILGVPVEVKYVDEFTVNGDQFYLLDAWVNYGTELEAQIAFSHGDHYFEFTVENWLDDPESFYGEPEIA